MAAPVTVQMGQRGAVVLPNPLRQAEGLQPGDGPTFLDLGSAFIFSPQQSDVDALVERASGTLAEEGQTPEGMLSLLREERERHDGGTPGVP
jgi:bifunctional DNA-binding transcriptional regulator/antitoxin component of YhaV-PrlF toxin-antitoxin module